MAPSQAASNKENTMGLFKTLTEQEKISYRAWARKHYPPLSQIEGVWHPVVQEECVRMNEEAGEYEEAVSR